jgi:hypothetical protein
MSKNLKELVSEEMRFKGSKINPYEVNQAVSKTIKTMMANHLEFDDKKIPAGLLTVHIAYAAPEYSPELSMIERSSDGLCQLMEKGVPVTLWTPGMAIEVIVNANYPKIRMVCSSFNSNVENGRLFDIVTEPR